MGHQEHLDAMQLTGFQPLHLHLLTGASNGRTPLLDQSEDQDRKVFLAETEAEAKTDLQETLGQLDLQDQ